MKPNRKLLVFDIDGTLTDSVAIHQSCFLDVLYELDMPDTDTRWSNYTHHTDSYIFGVNYERHFGQQPDRPMTGAFEARLVEKLRHHSPVREIPGAAALLSSLYDRDDYAVCFATGSLLLPARLKMEQAGLRYREELLVASNDIHEREKIVAKAIDKARVWYDTDSFDDIILVGDGLWDLKTAQLMSIGFAGIGKKNRDVMRAGGMQLYFEDLNSFDPELTNQLAAT